jgi:signal transduction histidine kinase/ActR/RegA family two-component response regulator
MSDERQSSSRPTLRGDDVLRSANEQLTLTALQAQEREEEAEQRCGDLRELNEELRKKQRQLQSLTSALALTEQRERKRLATELHDYLAQMMVLGRLKIGQARPRMETADPSLCHMMKDLDDIFTKSLSYTRTLMAELSPPMLSELGLPSTLKWLAEQMPKQHKMTVEVMIAQEHIPLSEDQALLLYQSVRELLINVAKHAHTSHATVALTIEPNDQVCIVVRDDGQGFAPSLVEAKSVEHFGLFSIKERMEAMGGWFRMDSAPDQGATMTIALPLATTVRSPAGSAVTMQSQKEVVSNQNGASVHRLLLVDDHQMVRQGLRAILEGYPAVSVVGEATNGVEAVAMANALKPTVILMDINMPDMDGIEASKLIKAVHPSMIIIGLSVNSSAQMVEAMKKAGAVGFVSKDAAVETLYETITTCHPLLH